MSKSDIVLVFLIIIANLIWIIFLLYFKSKVAILGLREAEAKEKAALAQLEKENALHEELSSKVALLERECEDLREVLDGESQIDPEISALMKDRTKRLNDLLAGYITSEDKAEDHFLNWARALIEDKQQFMDETRKAITASHPEMIRYFVDHGLTTGEINYLCLYAIGLKGKEVGNYIKLRSHYNISSAIRAKLNIDSHETNIGIYVRRLMND